MKIIGYISTIMIPFIIVFIVTYGMLEKKPVFDLFLKGAKDGLKITIRLFPTLLGIFLAVGMLRSSGLIELIIKGISPITSFFNFPSEVIPLCLMRPISGGASTAIATDIMTNYGVDSMIGLIAATIMGSTETTFYTISVYSSSISIKKQRFVLIPALIADVTSMIMAVILWNILS